MKEVKLMIDNLVTVNNPEYHPKLKGVVLRVTSISPNGDEYSIGLEHINQKPNTHHETYSQFLKFIELIPLTDEWLTEKAKFIKDSPTKFHIHSNNNHLIFIYFEKMRGCYAMVYNGSQFCELRYVHQLQNLYFALTGEELEFNL